MKKVNREVNKGRERSGRENAYKMEQGGKRACMMALQNINLFLTF